MKKNIVVILVLISLILGVKELVNSNVKQVEILNQSESTVIAKEKDIFTVCIDPGHGGYDVGCESFNGIYEKDITLKVAQRVSKILKQHDIKVVLTRNSDKVSWPSIVKKDLQARCNISNEAKADVFVSLHCNGEENRNTSRGVETWCRFKNTEAEKFAKNIQKELANVNWTKDRGLKYESQGGLYVLRNTKAVSILVEMGFMSNKKDAQFISSESGQEKCAQAIAKGIIKYKNNI